LGETIRAEIVTTGSELMLGRLVDSNSAWLSEYLAEQGVRVVRHTAVGDDLARLAEAFRRAWHEHQVILVTGGLGPTEDDLTRPAAAEAFGLDLEFHEELAEELRGLFLRRGYTLTDNNLRQAWLPRSALLVPNPLGTAPGFALAGELKLMVFLPGVPPEMKKMVRQWLTPRLKTQFPAREGHLKTMILKTAGLGESSVDSRIADLMAGQNPAVGLLASPDMVRVLVTASGESEADLEAKLAPTLAELEKRLAGHIFSRDGETLAEAAAARLVRGGWRLSLCDAVTRGRLSGLLGPALPAAAWAGAWEPAPDWPEPPPVAAGELRLHLTARPDPAAPAPGPGETALVIDSALERAGRTDRRSFHLGGTESRALARAAALAAFHLWQAADEPFFCS
jgi:nicotinamide-nucleotide amidase